MTKSNVIEFLIILA